MSFFQKERYKYVNYVAPNLSSYAEFIEVIGRNLAQGEIEFFHRRIGQERKYQFEAIVAHPKKFKPRWEKLISPHELLMCIDIKSVNYEFRSNYFQGLDSFKILLRYFVFTIRSPVDKTSPLVNLTKNGALILRSINISIFPFLWIILTALLISSWFRLRRSASSNNIWLL